MTLRVLDNKALARGELLEICVVQNRPARPIYRLVWIEPRDGRKDNIAEVRDYTSLNAAIRVFNRSR